MSDTPGWVSVGGSTCTVSFARAHLYLLLPHISSNVDKSRYRCKTYLFQYPVPLAFTFRFHPAPYLYIPTVPGDYQHTQLRRARCSVVDMLSSSELAFPLGRGVLLLCRG